MSFRRPSRLLAIGVVGGAFALSHTPAQAVPVAPYVELSDARSAALLPRVAKTQSQRAILGFVVASGHSCTPRWDGAGPVAGRPFAKRIAALRRSGVTPVLSVGGQAGTELAVACHTPAALANAYAASLHAYGIHQIDLDLESGALAHAAVLRRVQALASLQRRDPSLRITLTLPVDTTGIPGDALQAVRAAVAGGLRIADVNVMAMDFGNSAAPHPQGRMAHYIELAASAAHRQLAHVGGGLGSWSRLAITVMIGHNDTRGEFVSLADARKVAAFAHTHQIAELRYWSFNRDRTGAYAAALRG